MYYKNKFIFQFSNAGISIKLVVSWIK